ncbi:MAG: GWxTD domain-containing protein [candidate division WOR-3 bacterium]|nr:GWxTD domain-containing protein [candidate division WOR-3 bacterium]
MKKIIFTVLLMTAVLLAGSDMSRVTFSVSGNRDSTDDLYETVNLTVPLSSVVFEKTDSIFTASLTIQYTFFDNSSKPLKNFFTDTTITADSYQKTVRDSVVNFTRVFKADSSYKSLQIKLTDNNSDSYIQFNSPVILPYATKGKPYIRSIIDINGEEWHFTDEDSLVFGIEYSNMDTSDYSLKLNISGKSSPYEKEFPLINTKRDTFILSTNLEPGKYKLTAEMFNDQKELISSMTTDFFIAFSFEHSDKQYHNIVNALSLIAVKSEIDKMRNAGPEEREKIWNDFWKRADINPTLSGNIQYNEFLRRYKYAMDEFGVHAKEGYKTDQGRIYIMFGHPDEIERHPFDLDSKPYEIWYYYSEGYEFRFVDVHGYGEFRLMNYYDQWR